VDSRSRFRLALLWIWVMTGCVRPATQLVVVVESDLPADARACVHVEVAPVDEPDVVSEQTFHAELDRPVRTQLPFSFGVTPPGGRWQRRIELTVAAYSLDACSRGTFDRSDAVVTRRVRSGFVEGQALRLPIFLAASCVGVVCGDEQTCDGGACVLVPDLDPGGLVPTRPGNELLDAGGLDAGGPDAGGPDAGGPDAGGPDAGGPDAFSPPDAVDVCSLCDPNATCDGTRCVCDAGFLGDGFTCATFGDGALEALVKSSSPGDMDLFGRAIAMSADGTRLAVGAELEDSPSTLVGGPPTEGSPDSGAVYVYRRSGSTWVFEAYVKASNTGAGDGFGAALALSDDGSVLVVGAPREASSGTGIASTPDEAAPGSGAAYVYRRAGFTWSFETFAKASNTGSSDAFGSAVAVSGDGSTLAVGAPGEDSAGTGVGSTSNEGAMGSGAVYVYRHDGSVWSFQAFVKASNTGAGDAFGGALALSRDGSALAVGAKGEDGAMGGIDPSSDEGATDAGATYVYARAGSTWSLDAFVKAAAPTAGDHFGASVSLDGDGTALAVGAPFEDGSGLDIDPATDEGAVDSGAAYVFSRDPRWTLVAYVKASNTGAGDQFGRAIALSADGTGLVVGAPLEDGGSTGIGGASDEARTDSGASYVLRRVGASWVSARRVKASNTGPGDLFGSTVALRGDGLLLAIGATGEDTSTGTIDPTPDDRGVDVGAVYQYGF